MFFFLLLLYEPVLTNNSRLLQNRMLDLKYSMQHLLARMLHKTNPKASLKAVDGVIQDVEAYVLIHPTRRHSRLTQTDTDIPPGSMHFAFCECRFRCRRSLTKTRCRPCNNCTKSPTWPTVTATGPFRPCPP